MAAFTKMTPNGKMTLYMSQRDFISNLSKIEPIDGAVIVEPGYIAGDRLVCVQLMIMVRYGREEDEVMGLNLSREICLASRVVSTQPQIEPLTTMQRELKKIYEEVCFPFHFEWPANMGPSLYIQQPRNSTGKPCGVEYYVELFCLEGEGDQQPHRRSSLRFLVDIVQVAGSAEKSAVWIPPSAHVSRPLLFSPGNIELDINLEKTSVADGEPLVVHVTITNRSNKTISDMKTTLLQLHSVSFLKGGRKVPINNVNTARGFPLVPGGTLNTTVMLVARAPLNYKKPEAVALRHARGTKAPVLAASTLFAADSEPSEYFGFIISYRVRVKLMVAHSPLRSAVVAQVPVYVVNRKTPVARKVVSTTTKELSILFP